MNNVRSQGGFTLITALFMIVVLGLLVVFMVNVSTVQQATMALNLRQARAYAAAQNGLEWATVRALQSAACANATFNLTEGGTDGFAVSITCTRTVHRVRGSTINLYQLQSTATYDSFGAPDFVSRTLTAEVADVPS